jgi:hypothetical protein
MIIVRLGALDHSDDPSQAMIDNALRLYGSSARRLIRRRGLSPIAWERRPC